MIGNPDLVFVTLESEEDTQKRILKLLDVLFKERAASEAERRKIWVLEEEERRRRMRNPVKITKEMEKQKEKMQEELLHHVGHEQAIDAEEGERANRIIPGIIEDSIEYIVREIKSMEVRMAEEMERQRRMQTTNKDGSNPDLDESHEKVQQEFMSAVHRKEAQKAEEGERKRRIEEEKQNLIREEKEEKEHSKKDLIFVHNAEEGERLRRIFEDALVDVDEEIKREIIRRQTWVAEERERRRRIFYDLSLDLQEAVLSDIDRREVAFLEEVERKRRVDEENAQKGELPANSEAHEAIQQEFMAKVHRKEAAEAEENERDERIAQDFLVESVQSEISRRVTWVLEEKERRRRLVEEVEREYEEMFLRELEREAVIALEEKERERRIRALKTHSEDKVHFSDQKEEIQRELLSKTDNIKSHLLEEEERARRIREDKMLQAQEERSSHFESQASRLITRELEEQERDRRIMEELHQKLQEAVDSETARRTSFLAEEEERRRRIKENKGKIPYLSEERRKVLHGIISHINTEVSTKTKLPRSSQKRIREDLIHKLRTEKK